VHGPLTSPRLCLGVSLSELFCATTDGNRRSCYVNRYVRERSPAVVIALLARWLWLIVRSVRTTSSHSGTHLMQRSTGESRHLWSQERNPVSLARTHVAWRPGNHTELDTPKISACPLAGWLKHRGMHLEPPSIRASRYEDWAPNTAYARGVMITGHLKCPICQNGGSITRSLHGHFINWHATSRSRGSPLAAASHATQPPLSGHVPLPWPATIECRPAGGGSHQPGSRSG
jgi:hypothetical protein